MIFAGSGVLVHVNREEMNDGQRHDVIDYRLNPPEGSGMSYTRSEQTLKKEPGYWPGAGLVKPQGKLVPPPGNLRRPSRTVPYPAK
jgi:hypothetical protein